MRLSLFNKLSVSYPYLSYWLELIVHAENMCNGRRGTFIMEGIVSVYMEILRNESLVLFQSVIFRGYCVSSRSCSALLSCRGWAWSRPGPSPRSSGQRWTPSRDEPWAWLATKETSWWSWEVSLWRGRARVCKHTHTVVIVRPVSEPRTI